MASNLLEKVSRPARPQQRLSPQHRKSDVDRNRASLTYGSSKGSGPGLAECSKRHAQLHRERSRCGTREDKVAIFGGLVAGEAGLGYSLAGRFAVECDIPMRFHGGRVDWTMVSAHTLVLLGEAGAQRVALRKLTSINGRRHRRLLWQTP